MRAFLFIVFLLLSFATLQAQDSLPAFPLQGETEPVIAVPETYVRVWRDDEKKALFHDVVSGAYQPEFRKPGEWTKTLYPGVYWLHYRLRNASDSPVHIALTSAANFATCFVKKGSLPWEKKQTGWLQSWTKKDGIKKGNSLPLSLSPGEEVEVYQRDDYWQQVPKSVQPAVQVPRKMAEVQYLQEQAIPPLSAQANKMLSAMIAGILLFAGIIYWRFYRIVRVQFYLHYALFLFGFSLLYSPLGVLFQSFPLVDLYVGNLAFGLGLFYFTQFFRSYLRTKVNYRRWDRWLIVVSVLPLLSFFVNYVFVNLLPPPVLVHTLPWGGRSYILVLDSLLVTAVLFIFTHRASAGIVATIPALLLWGVGQTYKLVHNLLQASNPAFQAHGLIRWMNENTYVVDLVSILWIVSVFSSLLVQRFAHLQNKVLKQAVRNERLKQQKEAERHQLIARQKAELEQQVEARTLELKQSLRDLKEAQAQLIQKEKMASLGELTAGIAHEIQNPLNFINNFSELNLEIIDEIKNEAGANTALGPLADDLRVNQLKVLKHGQRADAIVKAMLQHSRFRVGEKEQTDINALADEYLRLSYHGFRAGNKDFNATINTHFDSGIDPVHVVPEELGRVLLNLFNNAFYAVNAKKQMLNGTFEPIVSVATKKTGRGTEISVSDNGTGIPQKTVDKIYQPFFTTKPTGEGTGLGLSLSYDIVTKAYGGELQVETTEGVGTVFKIILPAKTN